MRDETGTATRVRNDSGRWTFLSAWYEDAEPRHGAMRFTLIDSNSGASEKDLISGKRVLLTDALHVIGVWHAECLAGRIGWDIVTRECGLTEQDAERFVAVCVPLHDTQSFYYQIEQQGSMTPVLNCCHLGQV